MSIDVLDRGIGIPGPQLSDVFLPMMQTGNIGSVHEFGLSLTLAKKSLTCNMDNYTYTPAQTEE